MSNFNITGSKILIATLLGLGALGVSGISAKADVTNQLGKCQSFSKEKVVRCCDHIIRYSKKPNWMIENQDNCATVVKCIVSRENKQFCYVKHDIPLGGGGGSTIPVLRLQKN
jgi:hypothetical protein